MGTLIEQLEAASFEDMEYSEDRRIIKLSDALAIARQQEPQKADEEEVAACIWGAITWGMKYHRKGWVDKAVSHIMQIVRPYLRTPSQQQPASSLVEADQQSREDALAKWLTEILEDVGNLPYSVVGERLSACLIDAGYVRQHTREPDVEAGARMQRFAAWAPHMPECRSRHGGATPDDCDCGLKDTRAVPATSPQAGQ